MKIVLAAYFLCLGLVRWAFCTLFARTGLGLNKLDIPGIRSRTVAYRAAFPSAYDGIDNAYKAMASDDLWFSIAAELSDYAAVAIGLGRSSKKSQLFSRSTCKGLCVGWGLLVKEPPASSAPTRWLIFYNRGKFIEKCGKIFYSGPAALFPSAPCRSADIGTDRFRVRFPRAVPHFAYPRST